PLQGEGLLACFARAPRFGDAVQLVPEGSRLKLYRGQRQRGEVDDLLVRKPLALVAQHGLLDYDRPKGQRESEGLAALEQSLYVRGSLASGLRVVVAVEGLEQHAACREVERQHLIGAAEVKVDRSLVHGGEGACGVDRPEQL